MRLPRSVGLAVVLAAGASGACTSDAEPVGPTQTPLVTSTSASTTTWVPPSITSPAVDETTSTAPATTAPASATSVPVSPDAVLTTTTDDGSALVVTRHQAATGSRIARYDLALDAGGFFAYDPSTGGELIVVNSNNEDFWFNCEAYNGIVRQVTADGSSPVLVDGGLGHLSADGTHLLYGRASTCGPDSVDPANWVHAPLDTIVWRDLASGQEQAWSFPGAVLDSEVRSPVTSLALAGDRILAVVSDRLVVFDPAVGSPDTVSAPAIDQPGDEVVELLGARPDGMVVGIRRSTSQSGARLVELDPTSGAETEIASHPDHTVAALHLNGIDLAVLTDGVLTINGTEVVLDGVDVGAITSIGW